MKREQNLKANLSYLPYKISKESRAKPILVGKDDIHKVFKKEKNKIYFKKDLALFKDSIPLNIRTKQKFGDKKYYSYDFKSFYYNILSRKIPGLSKIGYPSPQKFAIYSRAVRVKEKETDRFICAYLIEIDGFAKMANSLYNVNGHRQEKIKGKFIVWDFELKTLFGFYNVVKFRIKKTFIYQRNRGIPIEVGEKLNQYDENLNPENAKKETSKNLMEDRRLLFSSIKEKSIFPYDSYFKAKTRDYLINLESDGVPLAIIGDNLIYEKRQEKILNLKSTDGTIKLTREKTINGDEI